MIPLYSHYGNICNVASMVSRTRWSSVILVLLFILLLCAGDCLSVFRPPPPSKKKKRENVIHIHTFTPTHTHLSLTKSGSLESTFLRFMGSDLDSINESHLHKIRKREEKESHYSHPPVAGRQKGRSKSGIHNFLGLLLWITHPRAVGLWNHVHKFLEFLHFLICTKSAALTDPHSWLPQLSPSFISS